MHLVEKTFNTVLLDTNVWKAFESVGFEYAQDYSRVAMTEDSLHRFVAEKRCNHELTEVGTHGLTQRGMKLRSKFYLDAKDGLRALERDGYIPEMHLQHMTERSAEALFNASLAFDPPERKLKLAEWEQRVYVPHSLVDQAGARPGTFVATAAERDRAAEVMSQLPLSTKRRRGRPSKKCVSVDESALATLLSQGTAQPVTADKHEEETLGQPQQQAESQQQHQQQQQQQQQQQDKLPNVELDKHDAKRVRREAKWSDMRRRRALREQLQVRFPGVDLDPLGNKLGRYYTGMRDLAWACSQVKASLPGVAAAGSRGVEERREKPQREEAKPASKPKRLRQVHG